MTHNRFLIFLTVGCGFATINILPAAAMNFGMTAPAIHATLDRAKLDKGNLHKVNDYLAAPPPYPEGYVPPKLDQEGLQAQVDGHLKEMFDKAADPSSHLVTMAAAKNTGWGFVSDHFAEIDANQDGFITYGEYKRFLDARSPVKRQPKGDVQVVE